MRAIVAILAFIIFAFPSFAQNTVQALSLNHMPDDGAKIFGEN